MKVRLITIGQSPRDDMVPEMVAWLPECSVSEYGALDGLDADQIARCAPHAGEEVLTTRLADRTNVVIGREIVGKLLQKQISLAENAGVDANLVVCTGRFHDFSHDKPLYSAQELLERKVQNIAQKYRCIGVITPLIEQDKQAIEKFGQGKVVFTAHANPYSLNSDKEINQAAYKLVQNNAEIIVLDCMGYRLKHSYQVQKIANVPVLLARKVVVVEFAQALMKSNGLNYC